MSYTNSVPDNSDDQSGLCIMSLHLTFELGPFSANKNQRMYQAFSLVINNVSYNIIYYIYINSIIMQGRFKMEYR
jgi:hypothetical protein